MIEHLVSWLLKPNVFTPDAQELTMQELIAATANKTNDVIDDVNKKEYSDNITNVRKLDTNGNFTGTWNGYKPSQTDQSLPGVVEGIQADISKIKGNIINIKDYGAVGDGITDDAAKIQTAIDAGNAIYFPDGNYLINSGINLHSNMVMFMSKNAKIFTLTNATGFNLVNAYKQTNILIINCHIEGVDGTGTAAPPVGTVEGQGVTLGFYGCSNIKVINSFFAHNGNGSGNIYFSKCKNSIIANNYINKTGGNAICIDNYYGDDSGYCAGHSENIAVVNNIVDDAGGRGIAIDLGTSNNEEILISGNIFKGCAYAGLSVNMNGFIIDNNLIEGRRDLGATTEGGQQSEPTYYGIASEAGVLCNGIIANNRINFFYKDGILAHRAHDLKIINNDFIMGGGYTNQYAQQWVNLHDNLNHMIFLDWNPGATNGAKNITIQNNSFTNQRQPGASDQIEVPIYFNQYTGDSALAADSNITVAHNIFNLYRASNIIQYYSSSSGRYGNINIIDNRFNITILSGCAIVAGNLANVIIRNNKFYNVHLGANFGMADTILCENNIFKNYEQGYYFDIGNLTGQIVNFICKDTVIGSPTSGNYFFSGAYPGGYIITNSDASGMKFIGMSVNQIKSCAYPKRILIPNVNDATAGYWNVGDIYLFLTPTTMLGKICTTEGTAGSSAVFKSYIAIS